MSELPASGDPFARAYAKNGVQRPGQPGIPGMGMDVQQAVARAGYGFAPPTPDCPPEPGVALEECLNAAARLLANIIQTEQKVPWIDPPFRARWKCDFVQAILTPTAAVGPVAFNTAQLMLTANTTPCFTPILLQFETVDDFQELYTLEPPQGYMARISSWGISAGASGPKSFRIRSKSAAVGGNPDPPDPFLSSFQAAQHEPTFVLLQSQQVLRLEVAPCDLACPVMLNFGVCYWFWPVQRRIDSPEGSILRGGYGLDC